MFRLNYLVKIAVVYFMALAVTTPSIAGNKEEELKNEISYLAKQLLDISGEDSITIEKPAYMKPFIGICSDVLSKGIKLTCITPGHNASKAGLKTGDLILSVNDIDMTGSVKDEHDSAFYKLTRTMKTGDKLTMKLIRKGKERTIDVTVGAVSHPAYTLIVKKK